jgi:hypothetical protein
MGDVMKPLLLLIAMWLAGCSPNPAFSPDVAVTVEDFAEYGDEYGRIGRIVLSLHNRTEVPIYSAAFSLELETDSRHYYTTMHDDRGIPPAMKVFIVVEFVYILPDERGSISGVTVTDSFFM